MCYTDSAAFKFNPTHCSACNRPLVDATSVQFGIGPICRKKYHYEDAYPIDSGTSSSLVALLQNLSDTDVVDGVIKAVLEDDSRTAVNILNRAVAVWAREDEPEVHVAIAAMKMMGYDVLADKVATRLADIEISIEEGRILLNTPFDPDFLARIKAVEGRRWDKERKVWTVPVSQKAAAWEALQAAYEGCVAHGPKGMFRI